MIEEGLIDKKGYIEVKSVIISVGCVLHDPFVFESGIDEVNRRGIIGLGEIGVREDGRMDEIYLSEYGWVKNSGQITGSAID